MCHIGGNVRPRQFSEELVLRVAFDRFWRQGVRGTSLSDVAREAGVQRGSLYNAYGSKEALFLTAYARYRAEYLANMTRMLSTGPLRTRLEAFFDFTIANCTQGTPARGCPTTRGLMEVGTGDGLDESARVAFAELLTGVTTLLAEALADGATRGEFQGDPVATARHLLVVARGLIVLERAFGDEAQMRAIAAHTIDSVLPAGTRPSTDTVDR